ncbi:MAG: hypothetical protein R3232_01265 [Clostridia bacterium]|nr:hypothetical protein [Clostridia bacterium]
MISCTEFIPAYSEGFNFLEEKGGRSKVDEFWDYLSDLYLKGSLRKLVMEHGIAGCYTYWEQALNEEAADFTMTLDEENGEFRIEMHKCPSKGRLLELGHIKPYEAYCEHCPALYSRVLEPLGYEYIMDLTRTGSASCTLSVRKKRED